MKCKSLDPHEEGKELKDELKKQEKKFFFCRLYLDLTKGSFFF